MAQVTMPDGQLVDLPDNPTPDQLQRLRGVISKQHDLSKEDTSVKKPVEFVEGNINKGIAQGVGAAVDLANLVPKAIAATAAGHPSYALDDESTPVGGSKWIESLMRQHKMITDASTPKTPGQKLMAGGLQLGGSVLGGGVIGGVGAKAGTAAKNLLERPAPTGIIKGRSPMDDTVKELRREGYVFSPAQVNPRVHTKVAEGLAGKRETLQEASIKNQEVSNNLVRGELGVSINTPLTENTIKLVRNEATDTYNKVRAIPDNFKLDTKYVQEITDLNGEFAALEAKFPGLTRSPEIEELKKTLINDKAIAEGITPSEAIDLTRVLRQKATTNYKSASAPGGKPEQLAMAQAQRDAADAVERVISKGIKQSKFPNLYEDWVAARKKLAISHDVESVLNEHTGNISAAAVAGLARKGRPLTGGMEKVAKFARSFERTAQTPEKIGGVAGDRFDTILASVGAAAGYKAGGLVGSMAGGAVGATARPTLRKALLSKPYQDYITGIKKAKKKAEAAE